MFRRRRPTREVGFGFDSFMDVITNVIAIIIRFILVAWVSARSYHSMLNSTQPPPPPASAPTPMIVAPLPELPSITEVVAPLEQALEQQRQEIAQTRDRLLEHLRQFRLTQGEAEEAERLWTDFQPQLTTLERERAALDQLLADTKTTTNDTATMLDQLRQRQQLLAQHVEAVEKLPSAKKQIRYRTPVSRPVHAEEIFFECRNGRITYIDIATLIDDIKDVFHEKGKLLRHSWQVVDVTPSSGAFRLRYTIERQRDPISAVFGGGAPSPNTSYSYGLSEWILEPVTPHRGETLAEALAPGSA
ncbi:MAG: hypothetical protein ACK4RK_14085, partial [Gemmataceae bacterium]